MLLLPNLTGGSHLLAEIDGWHATRATRSYEGPVYLQGILPADTLIVYKMHLFCLPILKFASSKSTRDDTLQKYFLPLLKISTFVCPSWYGIHTYSAFQLEPTFFLLWIVLGLF